METSEIAEADFVSRLRSLGVETNGLSFGWMLNEYDTEGILRWVYTNLDSGNALTKREASRYAELKDGALLSECELESTVSDVLEEYKGLTLPGDADGLRRAKKQNEFLKERLQMLKRHERTVNTLIKQNKLAKDEVMLQISELKEDQARALAELELAKTECMAAAETVSQKERELFNAVAKQLKTYIDFQPGEELPKQLMVSGPFELYNQKRRQFKCQLKMSAARRLDAERWRDHSDVGGQQVDGRTAKLAEKRLYDAIINYVETVSEYHYTYNVIQVMTNPVDVHPSRVPSLLSEKQSSLSRLQQQEQLLLEQVRGAAARAAGGQTRAARAATVGRALADRREIYKSMCWLHSLVLQQTSCDWLLYLLLRREWRRAQDTIQFADDVREYMRNERDALCARLESMSSLKREHADCRSRLQTDNKVLNALGLLCEEPDGDSSELRIADVETRTREMKEEIELEFERKEQFLEEMSKLMQPLADHVWDGRTRCPAVTDHVMAGLVHRLRASVTATDARLTRQVDHFTSVRGKDKDIRRKLWQWFLADPDRLVAKLEEMRRKYQYV